MKRRGAMLLEAIIASVLLAATMTACLQLLGTAAAQRRAIRQQRAALREALEADRGGVARRELTFLYTEERLHLEALLAEASGDVATAGSRWRELVRGRFPVLVQTGQRHLEELERAP